MANEEIQFGESCNYFKNPRIITEKQFGDLSKWIAELGDLSGIVHDVVSNQIISGNQRSRVFKDRAIQVEITHRFDPPTRVGTVAVGFIICGDERFNYRQVKWTPQQCEKANIIANKAGGTWEWETLSNQFEATDLLDWGFTAEDLGGFNPPKTDTSVPGAGYVAVTVATSASDVYEFTSVGDAQVSLARLVTFLTSEGVAFSVTKNGTVVDAATLT